MEIVKTFLDVLTSRERRDLFLVFCAVLVMAGLQVVSVGSIMPFLQVAADPASVHENVYLSWIYETFRFSDTNSFLIALGLAALVALVLSNACIVFTMWVMNRYVWGRNHSISFRLLRSYLYRHYEYFLTRNSSELGKNILQEVKEVTGQMLRPALQGGSKAVVALAIIGFLFFVDPIVALMVTFILGLAYAGMYYTVRNLLDEMGAVRVETNTLRYQLVNEAFGSIKEVKLRGKEQTFLEQYKGPSKRYARVQSDYRVIKKAPRYILEAIAFGGILLIAVYLIAIEKDIRQVIPMLGLYAFAGYRLMPALQQAFRGIASARFNIAALEKIHEELQDRADFSTYASTNGEPEMTEDSVTLDDRLEIKDVSYTYPEAEEPAIRDLNLEIRAGTIVGFVGKTGSGKTTAIDLILGLLRPQEGMISVDGAALRGSNIRRWQQNIGYVPQRIYLTDDTVAQNVALGVPEDDIDMSRVRDAAQRAHIDKFVENDLPDQWDTVVGERGVKLSGGQQQRVGIARALYHQPSLLVFDEATSALDQATEASVMKAIYELEGDHTMLMIAHRLSTVRRADKIIMLEHGRKVGEGTYNDLSNLHSKFQSMAFS